jgi:hypothetical protein
MNVLVTAARVSFGRSWLSPYGFSSQLLMVNREFATLFILLLVQAIGNRVSKGAGFAGAECQSVALPNESR